MTSNIGPWNDFEIVKPKGIKRKETGGIIAGLIEESKTNM
jgi:nucleoside diphosphate kinase